MREYDCEALRKSSVLLQGTFQDSVKASSLQKVSRLENMWNVQLIMSIPFPFHIFFLSGAVLMMLRKAIVMMAGKHLMNK